MSWNHPVTNTDAKPKKGRMKPVLAGGCLILLCLLVVVLFALLRDGDAPVPAKDNEPKKKIPDAEPHVKTNRVVLPQPINAQPFTKGMNGKVETDENGQKWFNGAPVPEAKPGERYLHGRKLNKPKIFKYHSENMLAGVLAMRPGMRSSAKVKFPERLDADFAKSMNEQIVIKPEDDAETAAMKQAVIEAKDLIAKRIKQGETFHDVYFELSDACAKVANIRSELLRVRREMIKDGASDQELAQHIEESNRLLKEYGAKSIALPIAVRMRLAQEDNVDLGKE